MPNIDKNKQDSNNGIDEKGFVISRGQLAEIYSKEQQEYQRFEDTIAPEGHTTAMGICVKKFLVAGASSNDSLLKMIKRKKNIRSSFLNLDQEGFSFRTYIADFKISGLSLTFILGKFFEKNSCRTVFNLTTEEIDGEVMRTPSPLLYNSVAFQFQSLSPKTMYRVVMLGVDVYRNDTRQLDSMIGIMDLQGSPSNNYVMDASEITNISSKESDNFQVLPNRWHEHKKLKNIATLSTMKDKQTCSRPVLEGEVIKTCYVEQPVNVDDNTLYAIVDDIIATMLKQGLLPFVNTASSRVHFPHFSLPFTLSKTRPLCLPPCHQLGIAPGGQNQQNESNVFDYSNLYNRQRTFLTWPHRQIISSEDLANAGFFWTNDRKTIVCTGCSCKIEIEELISNNFDPIQRHRQVSPNCRYLNNTFSNNAERFALYQNHSSTSLDIESDESVSSVSLLDHVSDNHQKASLCANKPNITSDDGSRTKAANQELDYSTKEVSEEERHSQNNPNQFVAQADACAYPIRNLQYNDPNSRRQTFRYWDPEKYRDIDKLVDAGFFFTGDEDIVRCFHCDIGLAEWNQTDDPWVEHARHSPKCLYLRENKSEQFIDEVQSAWSRVYTPKHPEYSERSSRLRTFENSTWPREYVLQTPAQLADAGFYYTGDRDTVRCHYCDGGMREWEPGDDPWIEHARWFPFCKYVLKMKGIQFIHQCSTGEGSRPAESAPSVPAKLPTAYTQTGESLSCEEEWKKKERMNPLLTAAAQSVKELGYSKTTLEIVINEYISKEGKRDFSAEDLMYIIIDLEDKGIILPEENEEASSLGSAGWQVDENEEFIFTPDAIRKENEVMKNKFLCILCSTKERTMVFVPCGHRLMCEICASQQKKCTHCETSINNMVKSYLC